MSLPFSLPLNRLDAVQFYEDRLKQAIGKSEDHHRETQRWLIRNDLFYLMVVGCGRKDVNRDWLFDRCREVQKTPDGRLDLWSREHYKMQRLDEPQPTPDGWKLHGDLVVGDNLFGPDGKICSVIALNEIVTDGAAYEIEFDDGTKIESGAEHLWDVERRCKRRIPGTEKRGYRETITIRTEEIFHHNHKPDHRLSIPVNQALELPEMDLPIEPYLLGLWLGDGTSSNGAITSGDPDVFEFVKADGGNVGHDMTPGRTAEYRTIYGLQGQLRGLGILGKGLKRIPDAYLRASKSQRLQLLRGLMDSDGTCDMRGTATFVNTSDALVDGFVELAATLGYKPHRRHVIGTYKYEPYPFWQVSFQAYKDNSPFRLARHTARCKDGSRPNPRRYIIACRKVRPSPMRCIQVDREDGMYLTGRSMVPTHNSSLITFGLSLQDILNNPEVTIGIFSHTKGIARGFLKQIKRELETNERLKTLFPDILYANPQKDAPKWSEDGGLIVRRKGNPKESTVEAHGLVDGQPTSKHFSHLIYDDVVTIESVTSPDMIRKVTDAWALSLSLGTEGGVKRYIGTRYNYADTYAEIMDREAATPRIHAATDNGQVDGDPVLMSRDSLAEKRRTRGPYIFACQYLLDPKADDVQGFKVEHLKWWPAHHLNGLNTFILCDPANGKKKSNDYTCFFVLGLGDDGLVRVITMIRDRLSLPERTDVLFALHQEYRPLKVGYEQYGMQADIAHIKDRQNRENYSFDIVELGGQMPKADRIKRLVPEFEQGRILLPETCMRVNYEGVTEDLTQIFIKTEYMAFPVARHDDMLDCLARSQDPDFIMATPARKPKRTNVHQTRTQNSYRRHARR